MQRHSGMFKPGQSGNPGGRPKEALGMRELARAHSAEAMDFLIETFRNSKSPLKYRISAALAVIERAYGKPIQPAKELGEKETYVEFLRALNET